MAKFPPTPPDPHAPTHSHAPAPKTHSAPTVAKAPEPAKPADVPFPYETPSANATPAGDQGSGTLVWLYDLDRRNPEPTYATLVDPITVRVGIHIWRRFAVHPSGVECFGAAKF